MSELKGQRHRGQIVAVEGTAANNAFFFYLAFEVCSWRYEKSCLIICSKIMKSGTPELFSKQDPSSPGEEKP